ncbi:hypothetical protein P4S83_16020 [Aneurinibacillus thermoaerophilus]|uniref:hypothetical protein n=1 Tax=Aneurinibacillus thermoaerophilus TaxID=143495 RepID=UPI002E23FB3B|nr:hypothetical protein [Aneurinibacillus thermoaerophilus]MED0765271.1 hypothetical protein [Aneurinibacillus thermoaerophilus]
MENRKFICIRPVYLPLCLDEHYVLKREDLIHKRFKSYCLIKVCIEGRGYPIIREEKDSLGKEYYVIINEQKDKHFFSKEPDESCDDVGDGSYRYWFKIAQNE